MLEKRDLEMITEIVGETNRPIWEEFKKLNGQVDKKENIATCK